MQNIDGCFKLKEGFYAEAEATAQAQLFSVYQSDDFHKLNSEYFVKIQCDGFLREGLAKGDIVKVNTAKKAMHNDTVLIRNGDELILKKWVRLKDDFYLHPETPKFHTKSINSLKDFEILGIVTSVLKNCS